MYGQCHRLWQWKVDVTLVVKGEEAEIFFSDSLLFLDCLMLNGIMHVLLHSYEIKIVTK